jgi:hypothetical protein
MQVAGGYGMTALYGVMLPIMAWRLFGCLLIVLIFRWPAATA